MTPKKRVLLKMGGETLSGQSDDKLKREAPKDKFQREALDFIASEIMSVHTLCELGIVLGGGNLIRGSILQKEIGLKDAPTADYAGMVATVINGLILQSILEKEHGLETRVSSAIEIKELAEPYIRRKVLNHLKKGRVVLLVGGTGNTRFSTDTAMVHRAREIEADIILKGTKVDGIYEEDPKENPKAKLIPHITYQDYLNKRLGIIDSTAVTFAQDNQQKIRIFNIFIQGNLKKAISGEEIGSEISEQKKES